MNRTILVGISLFFMILGIAVTGNENEATADWGCYGCYGNTIGCQGCYGVADRCHSCYGVPDRCHGVCYGYSASSSHRSHRSPFSWFRKASHDTCHSANYSCDCSCAGVPSCSGCYGDYAVADYAVVQETPVTFFEDGFQTVTPMPVEAPPPVEASPTPADDDTTMRDRAIINVRVPADAKVWENGRATVSTGTQRRYEAVDLKPGTFYRYEFRAELTSGGKRNAQTKVVLVRAGQNLDVAFDFPAGDVITSYQRQSPVWRQ